MSAMPTALPVWRGSPTSSTAPPKAMAMPRSAIQPGRSRRTSPASSALRGTCVSQMIAAVEASTPMLSAT